MTLLLKLAGSALLLLSMVAVSGGYRAQIRRRLRSVRAWRSLLQQLYYTVQQTGMTLSEWLRGVTTDADLLDALGVTAPVGELGGQACLASLCHQAARLMPPDHAATLSLLRLSESLGAARGTEEIGELLQALQQRLAELESETEREWREHCRVVQALCICGALAAILLLW